MMEGLAGNLSGRGNAARLTATGSVGRGRGMKKTMLHDMAWR